MIMKIVLDENAYMPTKAHFEDAGFDLYSPISIVVPKGGYVSIDTGVHIQIPSGMVGFLKSKSGLNVKHSILSEGVIDSGYTGSIIVKLYNHSDTDYIIEKGNKITQIVFLPIPSITLKQVKSIEDSSRGDNGFGSSGK